MASHCLFTSSRFVLKQPKYFILIYDFLFRYFNVLLYDLTSAYFNLCHFHFGLFLRFKSPPQSLYPCGRQCLSITSKDRALAIFTLERIWGIDSTMVPLRLNTLSHVTTYICVHMKRRIHILTHYHLIDA